MARATTGNSEDEHQAGGSHHQHGDSAHAHDTAQGIEWEDDMVEINRKTTPANTRWKLVDRGTGAENAQIDWTFRVGDQVKMRLVNEMDSDHPMPHPFHVHGADRFLILLDVTNAGRWMAHCHIAEHHESGMMLSFNVDP